MLTTRFTPNLLLKYGILFLLLFNFPGFVLTYFNPVLSSALSYLSFGLLIVFYVANKRTGFNNWFVIIGLLYFIISSLSGQSYMDPLKFHLIIWIKYFIIIICGHELAKRTSAKEFCIFLLIGSLSIILQIFFFNNPLEDYGRYSGFYLNPNAGGFICILGYALSFSLKNKKFKLIAQLIFTFMGLLTFSRTFMVLWVLINIASIRISIKNANKLVFGIILLLGLITYNEFLPVKNKRLTQISNAISGSSGAVEDLNDDSRLDTWARFYDALLDKPIFGNGYGAFGGGGVAGFLGSHNSYLKIWGEAGVIPFLILVAFFIVLSKRGYDDFSQNPHLLFMTVALASILMTNHSFFTNGYLLFTALWLYAAHSKPETAIYREKKQINADIQTT